MRSFLIASVLLALLLISFLQFTNPCLYECDGYYHIKVPYFIRAHGLHYDFKWAQFSTFKRAFSDKEILFHLLILPFTFIGKSIHLQARLSVLFFSLLLFLSFIFIQRKFVSKPLLIFSILSLPLSSCFLTYINYLRPKTLTITVILLLVYLTIEKRWIAVFIISLLYPLIHISFPLAIVLVCGIETVRYLYNKEFFIRNPLYSILGALIGIFIHPNFPDNLVSLHLNAILVPWHNLFGNLSLNYGTEWYPANTKIVMFDYLIMFTGLFFLITILLTKKPKVSFHTVGFFFTTSLFFFLSMSSLCYWYFAYPAALVFLGMFFSDYLKDKASFTRTVFISIAGLVIISKAFLMNKYDNISVEMSAHISRNLHYERMANWMNKHIPAGEVIYHASWSDSPYFVCLNPKNYYLNILDPIYMYYYNKDIYTVYNNLSNGLCLKPAKILKKVFKTRYGYTGKGYGLYNQIKQKPKQFKILMEDDYGAIFQLAKNKKPS